MLYWIIYVLLWLPIRILYPTKIINKKNIIKQKSIWACNHQSLIDPIIVGLYNNCRLYALGKKELFKNSFNKWFYTNIGVIKVDRGTPDINAVKNVLKILKVKNKPILVFPTGTRMKDVSEVNELKNGVSMFALKSDAPIVPMVFLNKPKLFHFTKIVVGEPIYLTKNEGQKLDKVFLNETSEKLSKTMENLLKEYKK